MQHENMKTHYFQLHSVLTNSAVTVFNLVFSLFTFYDCCNASLVCFQYKGALNTLIVIVIVIVIVIAASYDISLSLAISGLNLNLLICCMLHYGPSDNFCCLDHTKNRCNDDDDDPLPQCLKCIDALEYRR